jgi:ACS family hexuronate transporter-like MFS transporter
MSSETRDLPASDEGVLPSRQGRFRLRWVVLAATALVLVLNYADRTALSVSGPHIIQELGLTSAQFGMLSSIFFLGYVPFAFIGGWLSDRLGPRHTMGWAVAIWSLFTGLTAVGFSFVSMLVIRFFFGFGEGPQGSVSTKTMRNWFPQRQMGTAMGLTQGATPLGGVIGTPLVVGLIAVADWRFAFVILGLIGLLVTIGWFVVVRDRPDLHPWARREDVEEQRERIAEPITGSDDVEVPPMRHYFKMPIIIATAVAFFGYAWVLYTFLTWFPVYLTKARGVNLSGLAITGTIPWVFGVIGLVAGGMITDAIARRTGKPIQARVGVIVIGLIATAVGFALIGVVDSLWGAVALMAGVVFSLYITCAQYFAVVGDIVPSKRLGGVMGFVHAIANLAGVLAPTVVGAILDANGSWSLAFVVSGAICIVGALLLAVFGRNKDQAALA